MRKIQIAGLCSAIAALQLALAPGAYAQQLHGAGVLKNQTGPCSIATLTGVARVGDTVNVQIQVVNLDQFNDTLIINSIVDTVNHQAGPVSSPNLLPAPVTLLPLQSTTVSYTYTVAPGDELLPGKTLTDTVTVNITDQRNNSGGIPQTFNQQGASQIQIIAPAIQVTKQCALTGTPDNPIITVNATLTNTGDTDLQQTHVTDPLTGLDQDFGPLAAGASINLPELTYTATANPSVNTISATGWVGYTAETQCFEVTDTDTCTVNIPCNPAIDVTKACTVTGTTGNFVVNYSGTVVNIGNVALTGVTVVDNQGGSPIVIGNLAVGASAPYAGSYNLLPETACSTEVTDTVTATGTFAAICPAVNGGHTVTDTATATCSTPPCPPQICISKEIACVSSFNPTVCGTYGETATGVAIGDNNLAHFCYLIRVWNCGSVALNNVVVTDSVLGINYNVGSLPAGQTEADATVVPTIPTAWPVGTTVNTAIATGVSAVNAADTVTAQDSATAVVYELGLTCEKLVSLSADPATATTTVEIPSDGAAHTVYYFVRVTNTGDLPLDVSIDDPACQLAEPIVVTVNADDPATDAVNEGVSDVIAVCSRSLTCPVSPADALNTVTVNGQVHQTEGQPTICDVNGQGQPVTATSICEVTVTCEVTQCVTRTQGYWFNHVTGGAGCATLQAAIAAAGGSFNLGFTTVDLGEALGYFWTRGKNANTLCAARQKAATQLIAAIANTVLLNAEGACTTGADLVAEAQAVLAGCDIAAIKAIAAELDAFNNGGDLLEFPEGLRACPAGKDQKAFISANAVPPGSDCNDCNQP